MTLDETLDIQMHAVMLGNGSVFGNELRARNIVLCCHLDDLDRVLSMHGLQAAFPSIMFSLDPRFFPHLAS